jgi:hypothetical protein
MTSFHQRRLAVAVSICGVMAGCATPAALTVPDAPAALRPPSDQVLVSEAQATGVQIYECGPSATGQAGTYEWVFKAPEAELSDRTGRKLGRHYAGPTWESVDGSKVVGDVKARDAGPDANAIPWLLLVAKSNSGSGAYSKITSIQRLQTTAGRAPATPCTQDNLRQVARIPYTAVYYFYAAKG